MHKNYISGEVKAAKGDGPGEFEVILSAPTKDRDGEVIDSNAFEPLPDHITFDIDHGLSTATTVGSGQPFYDDDGRLRVSGTFSSRPLAQEVRTLVAEGHIRTTSVAFMEAKRVDVDGTPHIVKAELLNGAFVPVPSNREAVVLAAKSLAAQAGLRVVEDDAPAFTWVPTPPSTTAYVTLSVTDTEEIVEVEQPVEDVSADTDSPAPDPEDTPAATAAGTPPVAGARAQAEAVMAEANLLI